MDIFDEDLLKFWETLNKNNVRYIMIGGFAVNMQGFSRTTGDVDLWLKDELQNRKNLRRSFTELGYGDFDSIETMQFAAGWTSFYIAHGLELDILTSMIGLENMSFDECYEMSTIADLNGIKVPFLHINHLIENKKAVSSPKDLIDVIEPEKIKNHLDKHPKP